MKTQLAQLLVRDSIDEIFVSWNGWWYVNGKIYDIGTKEHLDWAVTHPRLFGIPGEVAQRAIENGKTLYASELSDLYDELWDYIKNNPKVMRIAKSGKHIIADLPKSNEAWLNKLRDVLLKLEIKPEAASVILISSMSHHGNISDDDIDDALDSDEYSYPEFLVGNLVKI